MAYDKQKAHEYYVNYRKKGLKKGRKKGKGKKKGSTSSILGTSVAGLNAEGRIEASLIKEKFKKEMNEKLKGAKTDAEREQIRRDYSLKAIAEIEKLKSNTKFAKPKAAKAAKTPKAAKTTSSRGSSGSRSSSKSSGSSGSSKSSSGTADKTSATIEKSINTLSNLLSNVTEKVAKMTEEQKTETKTLLQDIVVELQRKSDSPTTIKLKEEIDKLRI